MKEFLTYIYPILKNIVEVSSLVAKFALGVGVLLITWYFMHIDYFPKDLVLGDGLIFMLITVKFLIIVIIFTASNYTMGNFFKKIYYILIFIYKFFKNPIRLSKIVLNRFSLKKIFLKSTIRNWGLYLIGPIVSFGMLIYFYNDFSLMGVQNTILNILVMITSCVFITRVVDLIGKSFREKQIVDNKEVVDNQKIFRYLVGLILVVFLNILNYQSNQQSKFLAFSSSLVREQNNKRVIIYVKKDYKDFFPEKNISETKGNFVSIDNVDVLLRGVGKNALLQYQVKRPDNTYSVRRIEIPNDALLVIRTY